MSKINIYLDSAEAVAAENQQMRIDDNEAAEDISIRTYWTPCHSIAILISKGYQNEPIISRWKFSLETVCGAVTVRVHDLYDRYGSCANKRSRLHPFDSPIRRIRFHLSRRVDQPLCRERLAHYSGNLCHTVHITVQWNRSRVKKHRLKLDILQILSVFQERGPFTRAW